MPAVNYLLLFNFFTISTLLESLWPCLIVLYGWLSNMACASKACYLGLICCSTVQITVMWCTSLVLWCSSLQATLKWYRLPWCFRKASQCRTPLSKSLCHGTHWSCWEKSISVYTLPFCSYPSLKEAKTHNLYNTSFKEKKKKKANKKVK